MKRSVVALLLAWASLFSSMGELSAQITWRRSYGGFGSDKAACVRQTPDEGFIIAGSTGSFGAGGGDVYVMRVDAYGEPIWSRTYGGPGVDYGVSCRVLADGYMIAGTSSSGGSGGYDLWLMRLDEQGSVLWERHYGSPDWDLCNAMDVTDDGFVLGGITYGQGAFQGAAYVVRTDLNGDTLWTWRSASSGPAECLALTFTPAGEVVASGRMDTSGDDDGFVTKLGPGGDEQWTQLMGGDSADRSSGVVRTPGGLIVSSGTSGSHSTVDEIHLVAFDDAGQFQWEHFYGNTADAGGAEIRVAHNGGLVLTGYNTLNLGSRDMILTVTDGGGWFQFGNNFGPGLPADGLSVDTTADGGYVLAGWVDGYGPGIRAMFVVKTDGLGQTQYLTVDSYLDPLPVTEISPVQDHLAIHPNPALPGATVTVPSPFPATVPGVLVDALGRTCWSGALAPGQVQLVVPDVPAGAYRLVLRHPDMGTLALPLLVGGL